MAATAQTRITADAKDRLERLAEQTGCSPQEVMDTALRRYERDLFLSRINEGYRALREDEQAWNEALSERAEWDGVVADGLED